MRPRLRNVSRQSAPKFNVTRRTEVQPVIRRGITFIEPVTVEYWQTMCRICGKPFDPFEPGPYAEQHRDRFCSEDCYVDHLAATKARSNPPPWTKHRAPTADYNIARRHFRESERPTLANISAERQRRLDEVQRLWESGCSPREIQDKLSLKHESVYQDLRALGIDVSTGEQSTNANNAKEQLCERIAQLIESGTKHSDIAPIVNLSTSMVSYHARKLVKSGRLACSTNIGRNKTEIEP